MSRDVEVGCDLELGNRSARVQCGQCSALIAGVFGGSALNLTLRQPDVQARFGRTRRVETSLAT